MGPRSIGVLAVALHLSLSSISSTAAAQPVTELGASFARVGSSGHNWALYALTSDASGRVYIGATTDSASGPSVSRFDPALYSGSAIPLQAFGTALGDPDGIASDGRAIFVPDLNRGLVRIPIGPTGAAGAESVFSTANVGDIYGSPVVVRRSDGHVFVGHGYHADDATLWRIDEYSAEGALLRSSPTTMGVQVMTYDARRDRIYYSSFDWGSVSRVFAFNPATGTDTLLGIASGLIDGGLAYDPITDRIFAGTAYNTAHSVAGLVDTFDPDSGVRSRFAHGFGDCLGILREPVSGALYFLESGALWRLDAASVNTQLPPTPGAGTSSFGPIAHWRFDDAQTPVSDYSGNGNNGTLAGNATLSFTQHAPLPGDVASLSLDGASFATIPDSPTLRIPGSFTISAWIRPSSLQPSLQNIISKDSVSPGWTNYNFWLFDNKLAPVVSFANGNSGVGITGVSGGQAFCDSGGCALVSDAPVVDACHPLGTWRQATFVYDDATKTQRGYLDCGAKAEASFQTTSPLQTDGESVQIGARKADGRHFNGQIDDVRIWNRALTDAEVAALCPPPPTCDDRVVRVVDQYGTEIPYSRFTIWTPTGPVSGTTGDRLEVPPGSYTIAAYPGINGQAPNFVQGQTLSRSETIVIAEGQRQVDVQWIMRDVTVHVVDQGGADIPGSVVGILVNLPTAPTPTWRLPVNDPAVYPTIQGALLHTVYPGIDGQAPNLIAGQTPMRYEVPIVSANTSRVDHVWIMRDLEVHLRDQNGNEIPGSFASIVWNLPAARTPARWRLPVSDTAVYPGMVGGYLLSLYPGVNGYDYNFTQGQTPTRYETPIIGAQTTSVDFEWLMSTLAVDVVDQNGASVPGSQMVMVWNLSSATPTTWTLPVSTPGTYPAMSGGYYLYAATGLSGAAQSEYLVRYSSGAAADVSVGQTSLRVTWEQLACQPTLFDANNNLVQTGVINLPRGFGAPDQEGRVLLPVNAVANSGAYQNGYPLSVLPSGVGGSGGNATVSVLAGGTLSPETVDVGGVAYRIGCTRPQVPTTLAVSVEAVNQDLQPLNTAYVEAYDGLTGVLNTSSSGSTTMTLMSGQINFAVLAYYGGQAPIGTNRIQMAGLLPSTGLQPGFTYTVDVRTGTLRSTVPSPNVTRILLRFEVHQYEYLAVDQNGNPVSGAYLYALDPLTGRELTPSPLALSTSGRHLRLLAYYGALLTPGASYIDTWTLSGFQGFEPGFAYTIDVRTGTLLSAVPSLTNRILMRFEVHPYEFRAVDQNGNTISDAYEFALDAGTGRELTPSPLQLSTGGRSLRLLSYYGALYTPGSNYIDMWNLLPAEGLQPGFTYTIDVRTGTLQSVVASATNQILMRFDVHPYEFRSVDQCGRPLTGAVGTANDLVVGRFFDFGTLYLSTGGRYLRETAYYNGVTSPNGDWIPMYVLLPPEGFQPGLTYTVDTATGTMFSIEASATNRILMRFVVEPLSCNVSCTGAPSSVENGTYATCSSVESGSICPLSCGAGYAKVGSEPTCNQGTYLGANPTCIPCAPINGCTSAVTCTSVATPQCTSCAGGRYLVDGDADSCPGCSPIANCTAVTCTSANDSQCTSCSSGYDNNGTSCIAINNCLTKNGGCDSNATCANTGPGTNACACNVGYWGNGSNCTAWTDCPPGRRIDFAGSATADRTCVPCPAGSASDSINATECGPCQAGYYSVAGATQCTDINECTSGSATCGDNSTCANTPGSYTCACNAGYQGDGTGRACHDIDECANRTDNCDPNAVCINNMGGFACECRAGYSGSGTSCADDTPPGFAEFPSDSSWTSAAEGCGYEVTFNVSATDSTGGAVEITCTTAVALSRVDSANGTSFAGTFPVGRTRVDCAARDVALNATERSFEVTVIDATAPALTVPANIGPVEATSSAGAEVVFTPSVSATDACGEPALACTANGQPVELAGGTFPIGLTTVRCTATDVNGKQTAASFTVEVRDTVKPKVTCPKDLIVAAAGATGSVVSYTTTATDAADGGELPVSCSPASGSLFPVGVTPVTCSASDDSGNTGACDFTVSVQSDQSQGCMTGGGSVWKASLADDDDHESAGHGSYSNSDHEGHRGCRHHSHHDCTNARHDHGHQRCGHVAHDSCRQRNHDHNDGQRVTHGFKLRCDGTKGRLQVNWLNGRFHLDRVTGSLCSDAAPLASGQPAASFDTIAGTGVGRYNGSHGATVQFVFTDAGEPGRNDVAAILIKDAAGRVVLNVRGHLSKGNHQAHASCGCGSGGGTCNPSCSAKLDLRLNDFRQSGAQSPIAPVFYVGSEPVAVDAQGRLPSIPLVGAGGDWMVDSVTSTSWPRGAFVVIREGGGRVKIGQYGYYGAGSWSYYSVQSTVSGGALRSVENAAQDPFERAQGPAWPGHPGYDRLGHSGSTVYSDTTVTTRSDYFYLKVSCGGDEDDNDDGHGPGCGHR